MKERLVQVIRYYNVTPAQLADNMGVQRSSISHVISGRNKPSFDFLIKLLEKYPDLNAEWMLLGRGEMIKTKQKERSDIDQQINTDLFSSSQKNIQQYSDNQTYKEDSFVETDKDLKRNEYNANQEITNVNNVKQVIIIYENDTFKILNKQ